MTHLSEFVFTIYIWYLLNFSLLLACLHFTSWGAVWFFQYYLPNLLGLPRWFSGKDSAYQCRRRRTCIGKDGTWAPSLHWEDPLEEETATHSSILAWRTPQTGEPGRLWSMGLQESDTTERITTIANVWMNQRMNEQTFLFCGYILLHVIGLTSYL